MPGWALANPPTKSGSPAGTVDPDVPGPAAPAAAGMPPIPQAGAGARRPTEFRRDERLLPHEERLRRPVGHVLVPHVAVQEQDPVVVRARSAPRRRDAPPRSSSSPPGPLPRAGPPSDGQRKLRTRFVRVVAFGG